jgi:UDP-N-acetyl-D-galactosamine dehydrogenase
VLLAVAHDEFKLIDFENYSNNGAVIFDAKAVVERKWVDGRL